MKEAIKTLKLLKKSIHPEVKEVISKHIDYAIKAIEAYEKVTEDRIESVIKQYFGYKDIAE